MESMRRISDEIEKEFCKPACVVNHSMEFLVAKRLPRSEAAEVLKRIGDYAEARAKAFYKEIAKQQGADHDDESDLARMGDE